MARPDVSIILVSFNTKGLLDRCLAAIHESAGSLSVEIIFVDNASQDGSAQYIREKYPECRLLVSDVNLGFGPANNWGWSLATGRFILALNTDAFLVGNALEGSLRRLESQPEVGAVGCRLIGEKGEWQPSARTFPTPWTEFLVLSGLSSRFPQSKVFGAPDMTYAPQDQDLECDWVPGAFLLVRREVLEQVGFFDERFFLYYEEVDLCRRIRKAGWKLQFWPEFSTIHIGGASASMFGERLVSRSGKQLAFWRLQSQYLYHRKNGRPWSAWASMALERMLNQVRRRRNVKADVAKAEESATMLALIKEAWTATSGGRVCPPKPWGTAKSLVR